jgi:hypothetical protein
VLAPWRCVAVPRAQAWAVRGAAVVAATLFSVWALDVYMVRA